MKLAASSLLLGSTAVSAFAPAAKTFLAHHHSGTTTQSTQLFGLDKVLVEKQDTSDDATEIEPLTKENFEQIKNLVDGLQAMDGVGDLKKFVLNSNDMDVEAYDHVVTPERTRPLFKTPDIITENLIAATSDDPEAEEQTETIFGRIKALLDQLDQVFYGDNEILKYATYPNHPEFPNVSLAGAMKMVEGVPPLEYWFSRRKFERLFKRVALTTFGLSLTDDRVDRAPPAKKYKALFTSEKLCFGIDNPLDLVPLPKYTYEHWEEDSEFARQFMNGVNPLMIEVVKDVPKQVTEELQSFCAGQGVNLAGLAASKQLFVVDYAWLQDLTVNPHQAYPLPMNVGKPQDQPRYFQAPQVLLKMNADDNAALDVIAIQLDRNGASSPIYTRANTDEDTWLYVKMCVTNCDSQFHEWVSHLGKTHLTMEPHIVAIHNTLRQVNHKVFTFLAPMVRDTLLLNWAARNTLAKFGPDSFGDYMTSVGTGQFMQLIGRYWSTYDFFKSSALPEELSSRGFDEDFEMPGYLYRHDGMKLWNAYGRFAADFVDECYSSNAEVAADVELQLWAKETTDADKAAINGFPKSFEDKATLAKTLQTLWWICSGLHAAVNYPQYDFYSYVPNKPLGFRADMAMYEASPGDEKWVAENATPYIDIAKETVSVATALTLPSKHTIDKLDENFATLGRESYIKFKQELVEIGAEINARNKANRDRGFAVYHYLHPAVVPASIDI